MLLYNTKSKMKTVLNFWGGLAAWHWNWSLGIRNKRICCKITLNIDNWCLPMLGEEAKWGSLQSHPITHGVMYLFCNEIWNALSFKKKKTDGSVKNKFSPSSFVKDAIQEISWVNLWFYTTLTKWNAKENCCDTQFIIPGERFCPYEWLRMSSSIRLVTFEVQTWV